MLPTLRMTELKRNAEVLEGKHLKGMSAVFQVAVRVDELLHVGFIYIRYICPKWERCAQQLFANLLKCEKQYIKGSWCMITALITNPTKKLPKRKTKPWLLCRSPSNSCSSGLGYPGLSIKRGGTAHHSCCHSSESFKPRVHSKMVAPALASKPRYLQCIFEDQQGTNQ